MRYYAHMIKFFLTVLCFAMPCFVHANEAFIDAGNAMSFEVEKLWVTAPDIFIAEKENYPERYQKQQKRLDWVTEARSFEQLAYGAELSQKYVKDGEFSLKWEQLHRYPTLACYEIKGDFSNFNSVSFECYSEVATDDVLTFALCADNEQTPNIDYLTADFKVDWKGWKRICFNFEDFSQIGNPDSLKAINGVFFFSKVNRRSPSPAVVLYLDDMKFSKYKATVSSQFFETEDEDDICIISDACDSPVEFNHNRPEVTKNVKQGSPVTHNAYFMGSRSMYGYDPKYDPGYVSVAPDGREFIHSPGAVQWLDDDGLWHKKDIVGAVKKFAIENGWEKIQLTVTDERSIRFDNDGHIYVMECVKRLDKEGKETDWKDRATLLLYAKNVDAKWQVYSLPGRRACFERIDGHNQDALNYPPVILLTDYFYFTDADHDGYLLLPKKTKDGELDFSDKICYAKNSLAGPVHSGGGNFAITQGDKIFIQFSTMPPPAAGVSPVDSMSAEPVDSWKQTLPHIPSDHPAHNMVAPNHLGEIGTPEGGLPAFVISYDRKTKRLSDAVFVGFGGKKLDNHNWAAITADSKGILHVVISGHIEPLAYTHTLNPGDISSWSDPIYIPKEPGSDKFSLVTYPSFNCDIDDNLLITVRSDTDFYNHRIGFMFKPAGKPWAKERSVVVPYKDGYHVWTHKVCYDRQNNRFFVSFYELSGMQNCRRDDYLFLRFFWPDVEDKTTAKYATRNDKAKYTWNKGADGGLPDKGQSALFTNGASDMTIVMSDDSGQTWQIVTTDNLLAK
jgi:hypothetical protein